jgi:hypothetical protein
VDEADAKRASRTIPFTCLSLFNESGSERFHQFRHAPDLANHVHGDHIESLLKFSAGQWNTLVNIGSALCGLAGQDCIGTNTSGINRVTAERSTSKKTGLAKKIHMAALQERCGLALRRTLDSENLLWMNPRLSML